MRYLYFFLILISVEVFSQNPFVFQGDKDNLFIGKNLSILEDENASLNFQDVLKRPDEFKQCQQDVPNINVSSSSYWIKFSITNLSKEEHLMLQVAYPLMDEVVFYNYSDENHSYSTNTAGDFIEFHKRKYQHQNFIFDLKIPSNKTFTYYLKVKSSEQLLIPISILTPKKLAESLDVSDTISGILFGVLIAMFLYNIFIYFSIKDESYLYYVSYILFVALMQATLQGYFFRYFFPDFPWLANKAVIISPSIAGIFAILFLQKFLHTNIQVPKLNRVFILFYSIYIIAVVLSLFDLNTLAYKVIDINALFLSLYIIYVAYKIVQNGYRPAIFFLLAWSALLSGVLIFTLRNFGILPFNNFTNYAIQAGSSLEVILLSFALADRINIFKKEKEESQAQALEVLKENERITREQNVMLEQKVNERTIDLKKTNAELSETLQELKETQSQLVNSEKMASLGQLTAGVAHEINNPINFVVSNINPLRRDISDIKELLGKYDNIKNDESFEERMSEIEKFKKEIDVDYVHEEIEILLKGITEGANRTAEIVKSLKNFSRLDENDLKTANINEGLSSSIVLLNQQLSDIKVVKNLGDIPEIECYPGKINQVFMNILTNAIEAISSNHVEDKNGLLEINTSKEGDKVLVVVKDNGVGMSEEIKNKIFEPFYTTKDVGKGTGLGLSISHGIIEKHNGEITVKSEIGLGTTFEIRLPIKS